MNHPITAKSKVSLNINHKKSACNNSLFTQTKSIDSTHDPSLLNLETNETTIMKQNSSDVSTSSKIMHKKEHIRVNLRLRPRENENNKKAESCFQLNTDCRNLILILLQKVVNLTNHTVLMNTIYCRLYNVVNLLFIFYQSV